MTSYTSASGEDQAVDSEPKVDGRRARGERARLALFQATLAIIEREGIAGVTHRNVTREAGLPATSAAYHFATINDLLEQTLLWADQAAAESLAACEADPDPIAAFTRWFVADFADERARVIAEYELFLYAARHPAMLPTARRWLTDLSALVDTWTQSRRATRTICAYIDGILLQMLVTGEKPNPKAVEETIRGLASAFAAEGRSSER
jgi:DNA-binding transcriptional regulator YbjK